MRDVYLLTEGDEGPIAVPHLELTFMHDGLELDKPNGEAVWNTAWSDLQEMSPVERSVLPDGSEGVVILVVDRSRRRRHRLVLATSDAAATEAAIRGRGPGPRMWRRNGPGGRCHASSTCSSSSWRRR